MHSNFLAGLVLIVGFGCFTAFMWATRSHFLISGPLPPGMRMVIALSVVGAIWFTVRVVVSGIGPGAPYAVALMAVALGLFSWTVMTTRERRLPIAFAHDLPNFIYRSGPYRYLRHPFYMSYILCWIGTSLATRGIWSWVVPLVMAAVYVAVARREERKLRASRLSEAYDAYRKKTAMFIPTGYGLAGDEERC
ncbi:MAG: methyltransferase [Acetobacteraceae bacterium]